MKTISLKGRQNKKLRQPQDEEDLILKTIPGPCSLEPKSSLFLIWLSWAKFTSEYCMWWWWASELILANLSSYSSVCTDELLAKHRVSLHSLPCIYPVSQGRLSLNRQTSTMSGTGIGTGTYQKRLIFSVSTAYQGRAGQYGGVPPPHRPVLPSKRM